MYKTCKNFGLIINIVKLYIFLSNNNPCWKNMRFAKFVHNLQWIVGKKITFNVQNVVFKKRIVRRIENANFRQLNLIYCMVFRETSYKNLLPQYFWKNFVKSCRSFSKNVFPFWYKKNPWNQIFHAQCELISRNIFQAS